MFGFISQREKNLKEKKTDATKSEVSSQETLMGKQMHKSHRAPRQFLGLKHHLAETKPTPGFWSTAGANTCGTLSPSLFFSLSPLFPLTSMTIYYSSAVYTSRDHCQWHRKQLHSWHKPIQQKWHHLASTAAFLFPQRPWESWKGSSRCHHQGPQQIFQSGKRLASDTAWSFKSLTRLPSCPSSFKLT